jgi:hypothetical protein
MSERTDIGQQIARNAELAAERAAAEAAAQKQQQVAHFVGGRSRRRGRILAVLPHMLKHVQYGRALHFRARCV